jgi:hypothetical protein
MGIDDRPVGKSDLWLGWIAAIIGNAVMEAVRETCRAPSPPGAQQVKHSMFCICARGCTGAFG